MLPVIQFQQALSLQKNQVGAAGSSHMAPREALLGLGRPDRRVAGFVDRALKQPKTNARPLHPQVTSAALSSASEQAYS